MPRAGSDGADTLAATTESLTPLEAAAIAALLRHRVDDGRVHAQGRDDRRLLRKAVHCGVVDAAGFPTMSGEKLLNAHPAAKTREPASKTGAPLPATGRGRPPTT